MSLFKDTPEKAAVRAHDLSLVAALSQQKQRKLRYFGLPGPQMLDVLLWKEHLSQIVAVEDERVSGTISQTELMLTAFRNDLVGQLRLLSGDIDSLITSRVDDNGIELEYPFDILNLDYHGGLIYRRPTGTARRVDAIKELIKSQASTQADFLLLMTFSCRNDDQNEMAEVLEDILARERDRIANLQEYVAYLKNARMDLRLRVYVPYTVCLASATFGYHPIFNPVITYLGSNRLRMVHFVMEMRWVRRAAGALPTHSMLDILTLPMMEVQGGDIVPCSHVIPVSIAELQKAIPGVEPSSNELLVSLFSRQFEYEVMQYLRKRYQYTEIRPRYQPEFLRGREADVYARKRSDFLDDITVCECKLRFNESKMISADEIRHFSSLLRLSRIYEEKRAQIEGKTARVHGWFVSNSVGATATAIEQSREDGIEIWQAELSNDWQVQGDCTISKMTRLN